MSVLLKKTWQSYNTLFYEWSDERSRNIWPQPIALAFILLIYFEFCTNIGPRLMKNRKPFSLRNAMMVYNVIQIIVSTYIVYEPNCMELTANGLLVPSIIHKVSPGNKLFLSAVKGETLQNTGLMSGWLTRYNFICQPFDESDNVDSRRMLNVTHWYVCVKLVELLDTVFFILRKKNNQISSLHLYHHTIMPIVGWIGLKYYPNGHSTLLGLINTFVHIIMYTYYLIAGLGPEYQKYLWWKKHLTSLQLIQFLIVFLHNFIPLFTDCGYPKWINILLSIHSWHFIYMFGRFYYDNYIKTNLKNKGNEKARNGN